MCEGPIVQNVIGQPKRYCSTDCRDLANRARGYGLTPQAYREMREAQGWRCAICRKKPRGRHDSRNDGFYIDHRHDNGKVRGLLCGRCNAVLGNVETSRGILRDVFLFGLRLADPGSMEDFTDMLAGLDAGQRRREVLTAK